MTPPIETHPSYLELDRVPLHAASPETVTHVETCARCRSHLDAIDAPQPLPGWAVAMNASPRRPAFFDRGIWGALAAMTASGVAVAIWARTPPQPTAPRPVPAQHAVLVASKGTPSVAVYVQHGDHVGLWDGRTAIHPGDRLRLEVGADGYHRITVAAGGDYAHPLFQSSILANHPILLPQSWLVDDAPSAETLSIVLSQAPQSPAELAADVASAQRDAKLWTTTLTIPKATE